MIGKIGKMRGLAQIPLMIALLIMAIAIPAATKLTQQQQDRRSSAAWEIPCTNTYYQTIQNGSTSCNPQGTILRCNNGGWEATGTFCVNKQCNNGVCTAADTPIAVVPTCESQGGGCIENIPTCQADGGTVITGSCPSGICCKMPAATSTHFIVYKNGACVTSTNTYSNLDACNNDPPTGNCYNTLEECTAAHSTNPNICPTSDGKNNYCATYKADYYNNLPEINGVRSVDVPGGTCSEGHCINCAPRVECNASNAGKNVSNGGTINSDGTGCSLRLCPPVAATPTPLPIYTCAANGGYCTGSNNSQIGIFIERINGTCAGGTSETCVKCKANNNQCVLDPETNTYKMTTGVQISSTGTGCYKACTPTVSCNCPVGTAMAGQVKKQGDANCDGKVTLTDFAIWSDEFTKRSATTKSNFGCVSGRTSVELDDFATWRDNFKGDL